MYDCDANSGEESRKSHVSCCWRATHWKWDGRIYGSGHRHEEGRLLCLLIFFLHLYRQ